MAQYSLFVLKVPLNTNQPTDVCAGTNIEDGWFHVDSKSIAQEFTLFWYFELARAKPN